MDGPGPWIGHQAKPAQVCFCNEGWICERHPRLANEVSPRVVAGDLSPL